MVIVLEQFLITYELLYKNGNHLPVDKLIRLLISHINVNIWYKFVMVTTSRQTI